MMYTVFKIALADAEVTVSVVTPAVTGQPLLRWWWCCCSWCARPWQGTSPQHISHYTLFTVHGSVGSTVHAAATKQCVCGGRDE